MRKYFAVLLISLTSTLVHSQEIKKMKITDLEKFITDSKSPMIINFWATWCMPCIEEIPYFIEEVKKHEKDSVKLLFVSLDFEEEYPGGLAKFIQRRKFTAPVAWLAETNADYFCPKVDTKWSGAIPATLFINNKSGYRKFFEAQLSQEELKKEIMAILPARN